MFDPVDDSLGAEPEEVLSIDDVSCHYLSGKQQIHALEQINLNVFKNEFVCILGPSGCGKSSLLGLLAGFLESSTGSINMDGKQIHGSDWHRGVVFQSAALYPWLNVWQNVEFGLKMRGVPLVERTQRVKHVLEQVRLSEYSKLKPYELSGGMKLRVSIARVIANEPRIMLMDEPFGALDAMTREQMQDMVRNIWFETQATILLVTHDIDEALLLGTRVLVLSKRPGKIVKEFKIDFTVHAHADTDDRIRHTQEFLKIRHEITQLIHGNPQNFII